MKTLFIEAKYDKPIKLNKGVLEKLPSRIGLVSSIQFIDSLPLIKKSLLNKKRKIKDFPISKSKDFEKIIIGGQILGCDVRNAEKIKSKVDGFLYVGDGRFHPLGIALATKKPVFMFNPLNNHFSKIKKQDIESYEKRKKVAFMKFLHAENVGILVSTKPGQKYDIKKLESLEKKYKNKKFYTFIADTIDYRQLENFPFIEAWVNTACPRIEEDIRILNFQDLK